ncbi:ROK family protein [Oscillochloris sp. ZM17-4]|uniref:ROK family protein n=1 Tax=Oscillochloris sp. ZM17-4 TaxID=2866714 RepID=UPI001C7331CE|nr:ROK family protein [Oscillochloris sp. ZM17-4]MBX0329464.1 ROK family protein [Oscillochloris sp. ZM17-4]
MGHTPPVYIGTDFGATTSKVAGVWADGTPISTDLLQRPSESQLGPHAVVRGWVEAISAYLEGNGLGWGAVQGVGVAIPGPRRSYGVLERGPNLPESFVGFDVYTAYSQALAEQAGRAIPLAVGNDGNMGGVAEAHRVRGDSGGSVLLLAPGSGLGCAYIDQAGLPLDGDTLAGMEASHMPAPLHLLGARAYPCGCGRDWGCVEMYTSLAGLSYLLADRLADQPDHPLASSPLGPKERALSLRDLAKQGDQLAIDLFDFQARALGLHVASLAMALDPKFVIIGGGLMDPQATTDAFRERYLGQIWAAAAPHLWPAQRETIQIVPATLGDLSQAIGAALMALYRPA